MARSSIALESAVAQARTTLKHAELKYYQIASEMTETQQLSLAAQLDMLATGVGYICQDIIDTHSVLMQGLRHLRSQRAMRHSYTNIESRANELESELRERMWDVSKVLDGAAVYSE
jgi:hypothetical protein